MGCSNCSIIFAEWINDQVGQGPNGYMDHRYL
jgi:hypothetical protein